MRNSRNSAFSLLEATIVLSIVGVALGGVWAVVSSIREAVLAHQVVEQYIETAEKARAYYAARPFISGVTLFSTNTTGPVTIDILPESMCNSSCRSANAPTVPGIVQTPYISIPRGGGVGASQYFSVTSGTVTNTYGTFLTINVKYASTSASLSNMTKGACFRVLSEFSQRWDEIGLLDIYIMGAAGIGNQFTQQRAATTLDRVSVMAVCSKYPTSTSKTLEPRFMLNTNQ